ncbi:hypothetical protein [Streptomyces sp. S816]|uniref:hypothetical protein n=1 Tax=Streptomyces sp. S816 TaxID=2283197 RepID=UPI00144A8F6E|nr:hypothetical protein [Streptomyces sp. S816]
MTVAVSMTSQAVACHVDSLRSTYGVGTAITKVSTLIAGSQTDLITFSFKLRQGGSADPGVRAGPGRARRAGLLGGALGRPGRRWHTSVR